VKAAEVVRVPLRVANSYLVIGQKTIIVDTGDPGYAGGIFKALRRHGIRKSDVSMIFITHGHIDHYGSVYELRKRIDAPVAIQRIDEDYMVRGVQAPLYPVGGMARIIGMVGKRLQVHPSSVLRAADIVFDEDMDLREYGVDGALVATPGHTLGSGSLILDDGQAIIGDLVVKKYFLRGEPIKPPFMEDRDQLNISLHKLLDRKAKILYPGHGGPINIEEISRLIKPL